MKGRESFWKNPEKTAGRENTFKVPILKWKFNPFLMSYYREKSIRQNFLLERKKKRRRRTSWNSFTIFDGQRRAQSAKIFKNFNNFVPVSWKWQNSMEFQILESFRTFWYPYHQCRAPTKCDDSACSKIKKFIKICNLQANPSILRPILHS